MSAFSSDVPASLLADYARSIGWAAGESACKSASDNARGKKFQASFDKSPGPIRDAVQRDIGACERISEGGFLTVIWPACGDDEALRAEIEQLGSNRARALKLFLHNKPAGDLSLAFRRAEALFDCGARRPGGRTWKLYWLKRLSRDWLPSSRFDEAVRKVVDEELLKQNEPKRKIKVETFSRPAHPNADADDICHTVTINIAASSETEEDWQDGVLTIRSKVPNRKIILCITPVSKGFDCGWHETNSAMAHEVMLAVATRVLNQADAPEPIEPVAVDLSGLARRPRFWGHPPEFGIRSVQVKKLTISSGPGATTYFVSAKSKADVYDAAPRDLLGARIIAAAIRVEFEEGSFGTRSKVVSFDLSLPNRCSLRNTEDAERRILETCLREWGLVNQEAEEDRPLKIGSGARPLSDLLQVDMPGLTKREASAAFGHNFETLRTSGVLVSNAPSDTALCPLCGDPHPVDIRPSGSGASVECPLAGLGDLSSDDLPTYTLNVDALAVLLAQILPIKTEKIRGLTGGAVTYLGAGSGKTEWSALLAAEFISPSDIDRVVACLKNNPSLAPGILICSADAPKDIPLPGKHVCISIDELFSLQGAQLHCNQQRLAHALNRNKPPSAQTGRPSNKLLAIRLANARRRMNVSAATVDAEVQAVKDMIYTAYGMIDLPSDRVIRYEWLASHLRTMSFPETP